MPHWLKPLKLYPPHTWPLPHGSTFSNHVQYLIRHSSIHTQLIFLPYTVFECRHNIRKQPVSTTIPSPSSFCDIATIRKHQHFGEILKHFFLMFIKTVSRIAKHTMHGKRYFLFPDVLKRWSFPKNYAGIWSFLYYWERSCFFFPKLWSDTLDGKWKMIFLKKIHGNMIFSSSLLKRWSFQKGPHLDMIFLVLSGKMVLFFPKTWYFFLGQEARDDLSQEIHGNMIFSVYTYGCYKRGVRPLCQKKSRMVLSGENTAKGVWRSRLTSWKELQQFSVLSWRALRAFSCIDLQRKKPGNLICRIEVWLLLQFIRLEIFYSE